LLLYLLAHLLFVQKVTPQQVIPTDWKNVNACVCLDRVFLVCAARLWRDLFLSYYSFLIAAIGLSFDAFLAG